MILDSDLGGGDRLDRVREIRATRGFEKLPIILLMPITESLEFGEVTMFVQLTLLCLFVELR